MALYKFTYLLTYNILGAT